MKPSPFTYYDPTTIAETADLLARLEDARVLAGGQSLMPMMNFRFVQPSHLIDLNNIAGLGDITISEDAIVLGAITRQRTILRSEQIREKAPIIALALSHVGHRQTRARGTIGGSLCHFDPSAELVNMAILHDAELTITRSSGDRVATFDEFGLGYLTTSVAPDEFLRQVRLRTWPAGHGYGFEEFAMRHGDFAVCAVSCLMTLASNGTVEDLAIAISGVSEVPIRLRAAESEARGKQPDAALFAAIAETAAQIEAISDAYITASYRTHLARILTRRALTAALDRAAGKAA